MNITIALAGNPNSGKTTLFNALTGSNQYVGNWPGVTVERKEACFEIGDDQALLVDLPGVYSLSPYSIEENITRHFIAQHSPDVVLNIVDATNIERNLYLTLQLMELERPTVIALNLMDELEKDGGGIDCERLSHFLGAPVVPISAKKRRGFDRLFQALHDQVRGPRPVSPVQRYDASTRLAVSQLVAALGGAGSHSAFDEREHHAHRDERERDDDHGERARHAHIGGYEDEGDDDFAPPTGWVALKLLEGDEALLGAAYLTGDQRASIEAIVDGYVGRGRADHPGIDALTLVADCRYRAIERALRESGFKRSAVNREDASYRIDRLLMNKYLAFPIFLLVMGLMFAVTFGPIGRTLTGLMEWLIGDVLSGAAEAALAFMGASAALKSLVLDGVIAGVGGVMTFLPQILLIFLGMSILEDSGYMARAAFITDKLLRRMGLSGRSFIPMLMGFGCTTTAIIAARGVENERDRRMTIMLTPFMSCGARLPVYGLFAAAFFERHQALTVLSLYLMGMLVMVAAGLILRKTAFREGDTPFVMELPPYRWPTPINVLRRLRDRAKDFLTRAGTLIFAMSVLIWFLQAFSSDLHYVTDSSRSLFATIGGWIAPVFRPLGFGEWEKGVALLSGLVAKEAVVSTLGVLYAAGDTTQLAGLLKAHFTALSAYSFLTFILLYTPCVAAVAALRREMRSAKYTLLAIAMQIGSAYSAALIIYQVGRLMGFS
ncbi:ferrous iron transport protein B [Bacillota bacterium Meth-B3]